MLDLNLLDFDASQIGKTVPGGSEFSSLLFAFRGGLIEVIAAKAAPKLWMTFAAALRPAGDAVFRAPPGDRGSTRL